MGQRPRYCWMIDTVGWHEQMGQIVAGLGLDAFVYCRYNPTDGALTGDTAGQQPTDGWALHWIESPDGTRALTLNPGRYCDRDFCKAFRCDKPLTAEELDELIGKAQAKEARFPGNGPILVLGGQEDYSQPFRYPKYPTELVSAWNQASPKLKLRIATPSEYLDAILPAIRAGRYEIPTVRSGSGIYGWTAFWMDMPVVKQWYRQAEHNLQAAEALATAASLSGGTTYPAQELANSWLLMALNMDRNILWGVAVDGSFADDQSWDTRDRFEYVQRVARESNQPG